LHCIEVRRSTTHIENIIQILSRRHVSHYCRIDGILLFYQLMDLKYTVQDVKNYLELIDNSDNKFFKIEIKNLHDYRISFAILNDVILDNYHSEKALIGLNIAEKNSTVVISDDRRKEANIYISKNEIRNEVFRRHGNSCLKCGSNYKLALDHIIPVSKGGRNCIENLQPLCKNCNSSKGSNIVDYRKACHMF